MISTVVVVLFLLGASLATAQDEKKKARRLRVQPRSGVMIQNNNVNRLLTMKVVKEDLKLSEEQTTKIATVLKETNVAGALRIQGQLPRAELRAKLQELSKKRAEVQAKASKQIAEILSNEQNVRFDQIKLQSRGVAALNDRKLQDKLKLTPEQRTKIQDTRREGAKATRMVFTQLQNGEITPAEINAKMREANQKVLAGQLAVLTAEQKAAFEKMQGKKIDLPKRTAGPNILRFRTNPGQKGGKKKKARTDL